MTRRPDRLPKLCGADIELGNFLLGVDLPGGSGRLAARALLEEIPAPYARADAPFGTVGGYDPQDWGRKFLSTNGGCFYIDLDHLECCLPEVLSAWDHVAAWHATLDHLYSSLDRASGLYWAYEQVGAVERLVSEADIERFVHDPPEDTRAWGRAMLLRIGAHQVHDVDWDRVRFRRRGHGYWPTVRTVALDDPLGFTRAAMEPVIDRADSLDDLLDALGATPPTYEPTPLLSPPVPPEASADDTSQPRRRHDHEHA